jgi:hypothetical protein
MAVPKKQKTGRGPVGSQAGEALDDFSEGVLTSIREDTEALFRQHADKIRRLVEIAEGNKATVTFGVLIDKSESAPKVRTRIRFGETTTDERVRSLDDPTQPTLFSKEELEARKKAGKVHGDGDGTGGGGEE